MYTSRPHESKRATSSHIEQRHHRIQHDVHGEMGDLARKISVGRQLRYPSVEPPST